MLQECGKGLSNGRVCIFGEDHSPAGLAEIVPVEIWRNDPSHLAKLFRWWLPEDRGGNLRSAHGREQRLAGRSEDAVG